jgi:hypothetical protein
LHFGWSLTDRRVSNDQGARAPWPKADVFLERSLPAMAQQLTAHMGNYD